MDENKLAGVRYVEESGGIKWVDIVFSTDPAAILPATLCIHPTLLTNRLKKLGWAADRSIAGHGHSSDAYKKQDRTLELVWQGPCIGLFRMAIQPPKY